MPGSHAVPDVEIPDELRFLVLALLWRHNQPCLFVILDIVSMGFMRQLLAVQIQMFQDAQIDEVAAATANLDVVFFLNVAPDLRIVAKASEVEGL